MGERAIKIIQLSKEVGLVKINKVIKSNLEEDTNQREAERQDDVGMHLELRLGRARQQYVNLHR